MSLHIHYHRRTRDAGASPAMLWQDLFNRMAGALAELKAKTKDNEWNESLHPRADNGQFGHGTGGTTEKPTVAIGKGGMDKLRHLFASGHSFTADEFKAATGLDDKRLKQYLAMLQHPKWSGAKGALKIEKKADGSYFVAQADGTPAPPPPRPPPVVETPKPAPPPVAPPPSEEPAWRKQAETQMQELTAVVLRAHKLESKATESHQARFLHESAKSNLRLAQAAHENATADTALTDSYREMRLNGMKGRINAAKEDLDALEKLEKPKPVAPPAVAPAVARKEFRGGDFKPAKNNLEAALMAVENGYADYADFGKLDVDVSNAQLSSLHEHLTEFPELRKRQNFVGSMQGYGKEWKAQAAERYRKKLIAKGSTPEQIAYWTNAYKPTFKAPANAWAAAWGGNVDEFGSCVSFNEKYGTKAQKPTLQASLTTSTLSGFHPPGCDTVKSIMDHEYGHQLDYLLSLRSDKDFIALRKEAAGGEAAHTARTPYVHVDTPIGPGVTANLAAATSKYGATNAAEFIAEAWAEAKNNPNPRPTAVKLAALIRTKYAQKFGTNG